MIIDFEQIGGLIPATLKADLQRRADRHGRAVARELDAALRYWMSLESVPMVDLSAQYVPRDVEVIDAGK